MVRRSMGVLPDAFARMASMSVRRSQGHEQALRIRICASADRRLCYRARADMQQPRSILQRAIRPDITPLHPRQSVSGRRCHRHDHDAGWRHVALRALARAWRAEGNGLRLHRAQRGDREVFRDDRRPAGARLCGRGDGLARAGAFVSGCSPIRSRATSSATPSIEHDLAAFMQGVVLPHCPPPYYRLGALDGRRGAAARRARRPALVRADGAGGAADRSAARAGGAACCAI